jgi:hypothetical protein
VDEDRGDNGGEEIEVSEDEQDRVSERSHDDDDGERGE